MGNHEGRWGPDRFVSFTKMTIASVLTFLMIEQREKWGLSGQLSYKLKDEAFDDGNMRP